MRGEIVQVSVSPGGLPKYAVAEASVTPLGLAGDAHNNPRFHGGPAKAVLVVTAEAIDELAARGFALPYGGFGENLTVRGVNRRFLRSGQRWRAGDAILELTTLRTPCSALDIFDLPGRKLRAEVWDAGSKAGDPGSPVWATAGFYASVVRPGTVRPGAPFVLLEQLV